MLQFQSVLLGSEKIMLILCATMIFRSVRSWASRIRHSTGSFSSGFSSQAMKGGVVLLDGSQK